jgi:hypothetical protein
MPAAILGRWALRVAHVLEEVRAGARAAGKPILLPDLSTGWLWGTISPDAEARDEMCLH